MNEKTLNRKYSFRNLPDMFRKHLKNIIIFISLCFIFFLSFQIYNLYNTSKINKNSIIFFKTQNFDDIYEVQEPILNLTKENNFYGILSKLELIEINFQQKNYENTLDLYKELLDDKNLDSIYKSAISSKASYQYLDLNFNNISKDYINIIENFISFIDDDLIAYQGIKLELNYLLQILKSEKNSIKYTNNDEVISFYNNIMNSEVASSATKERINKIHEFFTYK